MSHVSACTTASCPPSTHCCEEHIFVSSIPPFGAGDAAGCFQSLPFSQQNTSQYCNLSSQGGGPRPFLVASANLILVHLGPELDTISRRDIASAGFRAWPVSQLNFTDFTCGLLLLATQVHRRQPGLLVFRLLSSANSRRVLTVLSSRSLREMFCRESPRMDPVLQHWLPASR